MTADEVQPAYHTWAVRHAWRDNVWLGRDGTTHALPVLHATLADAEKWRTDFAQVKDDWIILRVITHFAEWERPHIPTTRTTPQ